MSGNVFEGLCDNFGIIFDHRPVLQHETCHFLKEFEEKRGQLGSSKLNAALKTIQEMHDALPNIKELLCAKLGDINTAVIDASKMCESVIDNEGQTEDSLREILERQESTMANDLLRFKECLSNRAKELDHQMERELVQCEQHYSDLENDMKNVL